MHITTPIRLTRSKQSPDGGQATAVLRPNRGTCQKLIVIHRYLFFSTASAALVRISTTRQPIVQVAATGKETPK